MPLEHALQRGGLEPNAWTETPPRPLQLKSEIGLSTLPNQAVRQSRRKGYALNILVAGESGLGKSTFLNTLFGDNLIAQEDLSLADRKTKTIRASTFNLHENGVDLKVTAIDTPGFGIHLDRQTGIQPVVEYVDQQLINYVAAEERDGFRGTITDTRVHICLYFIAPTGHSLTELDIVAMRALASKVNVIPVIAKADTLTREELNDFRVRLLKQIRAADIKIYPFDVTFDADTKVPTYEKLIPFAVVGSNTVIKTSDGRSVRARQYLWGLVEVENPAHSDFVHLRELIIRSNLTDLVEVTHRVHYERFRSQRLEQQGRADTLLQSDKDFNERLEQERAAFLLDLQKREESMKKAFEKKVLAKDQEFNQQERDLLDKREKMLADFEADRKKIQAAIQDVDAQLNQMASDREAAQASDSGSKKKSLLPGSSLLGRKPK